MFQNLRQGSQIFILHKGMNPYVERGIVETTSNMQIMNYYQNLPMLPLDISVKIGEKVTPYQHIPPTAESAKVTSQTSGEEVCIACSEKSLNPEVEMLIQESIDAINSVETHKARIETCKNLLNQLNPEKVREAQQAREIDSLKDQIRDLTKMIGDLTSQVKDRDRTSNVNNGGNKQ